MNCLHETTSICLLTDAHLERANLILQSAFQHSEDRINELRLNLTVQPDGWLLALQDKTPVGIVGGIDYTSFAYVGMMAVHEEFQRRGIGLVLMQHLLARLDSQGMPLILLDASSKGRPLYEKLGFHAFDQAYVMRRSGILPRYPISPCLQTTTMQDLEELAAWDRKVFGADRRRVFHALLDAFPGRSFLMRDEHGQITGYLFAQERCIGPWVAERPTDAEVLLQASLSLPYAGDASVVVPEVNLSGRALLARYGFETVRINRHMGRGEGATPRKRENVYGQTSLALG